MSKKCNFLHICLFTHQHITLPLSLSLAPLWPNPMRWNSSAQFSAPTQIIFLLLILWCARISCVYTAFFWSLRHCALAIQPIKIQKWLINFFLLLRFFLNSVREWISLSSVKRSARFAMLSNFLVTCKIGRKVLNKIIFDDWWLEVSSYATYSCYGQLSSLSLTFLVIFILMDA